MFIGITGIPGSGKSTILSFFKEIGFATFNSDEVVRKLYEDKKVLREIKSAFPEFFKSNEFKIKEFSNFIFSSKENLIKLEMIIHPKVLKELIKFKEENKNAVAEVPLLFEKNLEELFDLIICVSAPEEFAIKNISRKKSITEEEARKRMHFQLPISVKKERSNVVIENNGTLEELREKFNRFLKDYKILE